MIILPISNPKYGMSYNGPLSVENFDAKPLPANMSAKPALTGEGAVFSLSNFSASGVNGVIFVILPVLIASNKLPYAVSNDSVWLIIGIPKLSTNPVNGFGLKFFCFCSEISLKFFSGVIPGVVGNIDLVVFDSIALFKKFIETGSLFEF